MSVLQSKIPSKIVLTQIFLKTKKLTRPSSRIVYSIKVKLSQSGTWKVVWYICRKISSLLQSTTKYLFKHHIKSVLKMIVLGKNLMGNAKILWRSWSSGLRSEFLNTVVALIYFSTLLSNIKIPPAPPLFKTHYLVFFSIQTI